MAKIRKMYRCVFGIKTNGNTVYRKDPIVELIDCYIPDLNKENEFFPMHLEMIELLLSPHSNNHQHHRFENEHKVENKLLF